MSLIHVRCVLLVHEFMPALRVCLKFIECYVLSTDTMMLLRALYLFMKCRDLSLAQNNNFKVKPTPIFFQI